MSRSSTIKDKEDVKYFSSTDKALAQLSKIKVHVFGAGGGEVYKEMIEHCHNLHISTVHTNIDGEILFQKVPPDFKLVFE